MRTPSLVVRYIARKAVPFIQLYALYVLGHGEDGPGGGFQGGVIFASSFVLLGLAHGWRFGRRHCPEDVGDALLPTGCLIYAGIGVLCMVLGGAFLQYGKLAGLGAGSHAHQLGLMGIETGVMITVAAAMATLFFEMARPRDPGAMTGAEEDGDA